MQLWITASLVLSLTWLDVYGIAVKPQRHKVAANNNVFKTNYILSSTDFTLTLLLDNIPAFTDITVTVPQNEILDLFVAPYVDNAASNYNRFKYVELRDANHNLITTLDQLPESSSNLVPRHVSTTTQTFIVNKKDYTALRWGTLFFRIRSSHTANCLTNDNVVNNMRKVPISAAASPSGTCIFTALASNPIGPPSTLDIITNVTKLSVPENAQGTYQILTNPADLNTVDTQFDVSSIDSWTDYEGRIGPTFSFLIPPGQSLTFQYDYIPNAPQYGLTTNVPQKK